MERAKALEILTGFGKTHIRGDQIDNIDTLPNLLNGF
jgi:hypothetical protein